MTRDTFDSWFKKIEPIMLDGSVLTLSVDNEFYRQWLEDNYMDVIRKSLLASGAPTDIKVNFTYAPQEDAEKSADPVPRPAQQAAPAATARRSPRQRNDANLSPDFTFKNFVTGPCNEFAFSAAKAVVKNPGRVYNPLFIYGATALGKTHLMQAVGHAVREDRPNAVIRYVTSETFLNEYIAAIEQNKGTEFHSRYRNADVLLLDDVQFFAGKQGLQEQFFHLFNTLHNAGKQIILTCDRPAREVRGLEERLVSRFECGLATSVERPNFETRMAILRHKQASSQSKMSDELLTFIAEHITLNVRRLEGAITRALSYMDLTRKTLSVESLRTLLHDILEQEQLPDISSDTIRKAVAEQFGLRLSDMTSKRRMQSVAFPRQIAMFLCRKLTKSSYPEIAAEFGKTHATVVHACKVVQQAMETEQDVETKIQQVVRALGRDTLAI